MSSRKSVVKTVVKVETKKSLSEEIEGVRLAIESGVVDVQTVTTLKRLLTQKNISTTSVTITASKAATLASSRARKPTRMSTRTAAEVPTVEPFPSTEIVSAAKTVVMRSLTTLATEIESRIKKTEASANETVAKSPLSQGTRNIITCCKVALENLRLWQDHEDIGFTWVNKAYFGYISKLISLEMVHLFFM